MWFLWERRSAFSNHSLRNKKAIYVTVTRRTRNSSHTDATLHLVTQLLPLINFPRETLTSFRDIARQLIHNVIIHILLFNTH